MGSEGQAGREGKILQVLTEGLGAKESPLVFPVRSGAGF